jgi:HEAT repeat protein
VNILESRAESPAYRFLALLLIRQESFFERFADPARCSTESAVHLFRRLLAVDPVLDVKLARMLPGRNDLSDANALSGGAVERAMGILDQTSPGPRLMSVVAPLLNNSDPRVSSKGALFVGRRVNDPAWTAKQLSREDQRLRANALEASWGARSEAAVRLFGECAGDAGHRVAGNALIGLYMAGCPDIPERALAMSQSEETERRSTAAWAMGKMGDTRFIERLTALMRDECPKVRSTAIRSLVKIRRAQPSGDAGHAGDAGGGTEVPMTEIENQAAPTTG